MLNLWAGPNRKRAPQVKKYLCTARVLTADCVVYKLRLDYVRKLDGILGKDRWCKFREFVHRTVVAVQTDVVRGTCSGPACSGGAARRKEGAMSGEKISHLNQSLVDQVVEDVTRQKIALEPDLEKLDLSKYDQGR